MIFTIFAADRLIYYHFTTTAPATIHVCARKSHGNRDGRDDWFIGKMPQQSDCRHSLEGKIALHCKWMCPIVMFHYWMRNERHASHAIQSLSRKNHSWLPDSWRSTMMMMHFERSRPFVTIWHSIQTRANASESYSKDLPTHTRWRPKGSIHGVRENKLRGWWNETNWAILDPRRRMLARRG